MHTRTQKKWKSFSPFHHLQRARWRHKMRGYGMWVNPNADMSFHFVLFPKNYFFSLPSLCMMDRERGGEMRGGDRHTSCLVLSHTVALTPAPPGTTHSHSDFAHTCIGWGNISVQIVRSIVCLDKDGFCSFASLQHCTWFRPRWISANTVATFSCCLFVSLCLPFCI